MILSLWTYTHLSLWTYTHLRTCGFDTVLDACQEAMRHNGIGELCEQLRDDDQLRGQRVSELWLEAYLDAGEQAAVSRLSVFAGSFNAVGAAAVAYGTGAAQASLGVIFLIAGQHIMNSLQAQ